MVTAKVKHALIRKIQPAIAAIGRSMLRFLLLYLVLVGATKLLTALVLLDHMHQRSIAIALLNFTQ